MRRRLWLAIVILALVAAAAALAGCHGCRLDTFENPACVHGMCPNGTLRQRKPCVGARKQACCNTALQDCEWIDSVPDTTTPVIPVALPTPPPAGPPPAAPPPTTAQQTEQPKSTIIRLPRQERMGQYTFYREGVIHGGFKLESCPHGPCPDADKAFRAKPCLGPGKRACCRTTGADCEALPPVDTTPVIVGGNNSEWGGSGGWSQGATAPATLAAGCKHGACPNPILVARGKTCLGPLKKACCNEQYLQCEAVGAAA